MPDANVEPKAAGTIAVRPYEKFVKYLQQRAEQTEANGDAFEVSANLMDKILTAESLEDMWDADEGGLPNGGDVIDIFQEIRGYKILKSTRDDIEGGFGVYAVVDAVNLQTGEEFIWQTSATGIITKLRWIESKDLFPVKCLVKGKATNGGNTVLKLRPMPVLVTPGTTA